MYAGVPEDVSHPGSRRGKWGKVGGHRPEVASIQRRCLLDRASVDEVRVGRRDSAPNVTLLPAVGRCTELGGERIGGAETPRVVLDSGRPIRG